MANLEKMIKVARGKSRADVVLKNARVMNVYSGEIYEADVAIIDDRVIGLSDYSSVKEYDLQ